ncbi:MAG: flagellar biosynthesis anti-sigma factor FlgM [Planctomycetes bacterium]|nr:flagellar biosynthesis anti-sigma factor FlgM [Planctomycetota bacterium]
MVDNVGGVNPLANNGQAKRLQKAYQPEAQAPRGTDSVKISEDLQKVQGTEGIRMDKVMEVKKALADGTYITEEKLDKALDKAIDDAFDSQNNPQ